MGLQFADRWSLPFVLRSYCDLDQSQLPLLRVVILHQAA